MTAALGFSFKKLEDWSTVARSGVVLLAASGGCGCDWQVSVSWWKKAEGLSCGIKLENSDKDCVKFADIFDVRGGWSFCLFPAALVEALG